MRFNRHPPRGDHPPSSTAVRSGGAAPLPLWAVIIAHILSKILLPGDYDTINLRIGGPAAAMWPPPRHVVDRGDCQGPETRAPGPGPEAAQSRWRSREEGLPARSRAGPPAGSGARGRRALGPPARAPRADCVPVEAEARPGRLIPTVSRIGRRRSRCSTVSHQARPTGGRSNASCGVDGAAGPRPGGRRVGRMSRSLRRRQRFPGGPSRPAPTGPILETARAGAYPLAHAAASVGARP